MMTPGPNCHQRHKFRLKERGQITIFFAVTLLVVITIVAFIINIGLLVKAKINLQNSVDAAAYSGASVQARQLSRIGYLNWEMRNIYKEWMLKYYVLGNLNVDHQSKAPISNFTMGNYTAGGRNEVDRFNFPSICIHYGGTGNNVPNLCKLTTVPGVPAFAGGAPTGVEQSFQQLINVITSEKNLDCANRSNLNFLAANLWAYGLPDPSNSSSILSDAPQLAPNRVGAFPAALELAVRIRNLEYQVNLPPNQGVCAFPGRAAGNCNLDASTLGANNAVARERVSKAFYAGFRNLGNGFSRSMKDSFTLTELAPSVVEDPSTNSLSNFLIPTGKRQKYYLDLKLMPVNLVTFYTAFVSTTGSYGTTATVGECAASKVGLPVPGYPLGFMKNQDVMTYYSVKGEASFVGLFNPFEGTKIKLTAFATAKPFGGRIGPQLFRVQNSNSLLPRADSVSSKSNPYVMGLDLNSLGGTYQAGLPIPLDATERFWVQGATDILGGEPANPNLITFSIPNLAYNFLGGGLSRTDYNSGDPIPTITPGDSGPQSGLFSLPQLEAFRGNVPGIGTLLSPTNVYDGINSVRRPTAYEAANYLIPTPSDYKTDSFPIIPPPSNNLYSFYLYAPLFSLNQEDALYKDSSGIRSVVEEFINNQVSAIEKYKRAMNDVAISVNQTNQGNAAANAISDIDDLTGANTQNPSCKSINGKFLSFYMGGTAPVKDPNDPICPVSFLEKAANYWSTQAGASFGNDFYKIEFSNQGFDSGFVESLYTAYQPIPNRGASGGVFRNPISQSSPQVNMKRNFYSTKFIPTKAVMNSSQNWFSASGFAMISEGQKATGPDLPHDSSHKNKLDSTLNNADLEKLNTIEW